MKLENPVTLILSELLSLIKTFSCLRHQQLLKNLNGVDTPGYIPEDLPVTPFAEAMHIAINEYLLSQRLVMVDSRLCSIRVQWHIHGQATDRCRSPSPTR